MDIENLKYPTGRFQPAAIFTETDKKNLVAVIAAFPAKLTELTADFTPALWNTVYREGGWNGAQVVNHLADSHMNAYIRIKLGATEENPTIKNYDENAWANTADGFETPPVAALQLIEGLHHKWAVLLDAMTMADYDRTVHRTDNGANVKLEIFIQVYAWHCGHHLAHLQLIKDTVAA